MKKFFLFAAALCAAVSINAKVINIDLNNYQLSYSEAASADVSIANGELTVNYTAETWNWATVEFALNNLDVSNLEFEYIGDAAVEEWVSFYAYLKDEAGTRWYSSEADLSISSWTAEEWNLVSYFPVDALWEEPDHEPGSKPFVAVGFMANPGSQVTGSFAIRNVKLTVSGEEAIDNVAAQAKAVKVVRDGQVLILRDGKTFNALGTEMK